MYSEAKYHMANTAEPRKKTTMFAADSERDLNVASGTSGRSDHRPSMSRNSASSANPTAIGTSTAAEPQPSVSVRTIPNVSSTSPAVTVTAPSTS